MWPPRTPKKLPVGPKRAATAATASSTGWLLVAARLGPGCPQVRSTRRSSQYQASTYGAAPYCGVNRREFTLGYRNWDYICHRAAEVGPLVVGELHFARLACAPKSRPQMMRRAPRTARLGKLCLAGIGPLRARRFPRPTPARARRGGWEGPCQISRPTARFLPETASRRETRTTHRPTSYEPLLPNSSQIVVGHVVNDVRRCGGPIGSKRRQKRRS